MSNLIVLFNNSVLFWSLLSCLLAQIFKIIFNFFSNREIKFGIMFETGGMPSSHSALISGATSGIGLELGFDNPIFALAVALSLIVMYDASGIRRAAGLTAERVNLLSLEDLEVSGKEKLKERLGHTRLEVLIGGLFGPAIALPGIVLVGSPLHLLEFFGYSLRWAQIITIQFFQS